VSNIQTGTYLGRFAVVHHFIHVGLTLCHQMRRDIAHVVPAATLEIHSPILVRVGLVVVKGGLPCCAIHLVIQVGLH
jgi:hypothetical protein